MLIPPKATDTVYQKVLELLAQNGVRDVLTLRQTVLLSDARFVGYRFYGDSVQVDWFAQQGVLIGKTDEDELIFEHKISPTERNENEGEMTEPVDKPSVAA